MHSIQLAKARKEIQTNLPIVERYKNRNAIPPMTHELSKGWDQPDTALIEIDDTHATMSLEVFCALKEYSASSPSGVYEGKMYKSHVKYLGNVFAEFPKVIFNYDYWLLRWFGYSSNPNQVTNNQRIIIAPGVERSVAPEAQ